MATDHHTPMSPCTRRRLIIDYIVYQRLGMNCPVWWGEERTSPVAIAYRTWALRVTPSMRASLETMTSDALEAAYAECNDHAGWVECSLWLNELQEQQEEIERQRQYHLSFSKKGGHAHESRMQMDVIAAIQEMYRQNTKIKMTKAHHTLSTDGYPMPNGRVTFNPHLTLKSFERYWPLRKLRSCR
jgi:hypothetical protein